MATCHGRGLRRRRRAHDEHARGGSSGSPGATGLPGRERRDGAHETTDVDGPRCTWNHRPGRHRCNPSPETVVGAGTPVSIALRIVRLVAVLRLEQTLSAAQIRAHLFVKHLHVPLGHVDRGPWSPVEPGHGLLHPSERSFYRCTRSAPIGQRPYAAPASPMAIGGFSRLNRQVTVRAETSIRREGHGLRSAHLRARDREDSHNAERLFHFPA